LGIVALLALVFTVMSKQKLRMLSKVLFIH
jgi:hypothetical protein